MYRTLRSYAGGRWTDGGGPRTRLRDATTGETVAMVHRDGPDPSALLAYARDVGGPALRALTFTERAAILLALASHLSGQVDEFVAMSTRSGATRRDTRLDVDSGIAAVAFYADRAARDLPDATTLVDGDPDPLSVTGKRVGWHIRTAKVGAAVQLNACDLPIWDLLRRLAPAFLAGVPSVVKPARHTAYLTELVVRHIVTRGLLPEGALSLLCAAPIGLLDALTAQDTVTFTGSAAAARRIRTHPTVVSRSVTCAVETGAANAAILGPDVTFTDPEFGHYVDHLVSEMTLKAGQRSTAIRRAFVPSVLADDITGAIGARLAAVTIGNPALPDTEMGPLVSHDRLAEVRAAVAQLSSSAKVAFGDPSTVDVVGADPTRGAFMSPVLLRGDDASAAEPRDVVAFGPVCTILPYTALDEVVAATNLGGGGLAGTIVTHDPDVADRLLIDLAPWHGRLRVVDRDSRPQPPPEVGLPQLVHGGPGRAGGSAELGGLHALALYQQRTAVQGNPNFPWRS